MNKKQKSYFKHAIDKKWFYRNMILNMICISCLSACAYRPVEPDDPKFAPVFPDYVKNEETRSGGLFTEAHQQFSLYSDAKARMVGDIITVTLSEATTSTLAAETKSTRTLNMAIPNPTILGTTPNIKRVPSQLPLAQTQNLNLSMGLQSNLNYDGNTDSNQADTLTGTIAVTIVKVYPNGNLAVRGEKWLELAKGKEYIRLTGIIRTEDVASDNTIPSSKVADARIAYSGTGFVIDSTGPGWLADALVSIFWPF